MNEELAFNSMHRTATGKSSFKDVDKTIIWYNVKCNGLKRVIYDGGKCVEQKKSIICIKV